MNPLLQKVARNQHQLDKWQQLESLATTVTNGVIVELGTYLGYGTIALCTGSQVPVYTVDDYQDRKGWAGEVYYPSDKEVATRNFSGAGVSPHCLQADARDTNGWFVDYMKPLRNIKLLFWDLGVPARLCEDFEAWQSHITGKFIIHDTDDNRLGSDLLNPAGWTKKKEGVFWILECKQQKIR